MKFRKKPVEVNAWQYSFKTPEIEARKSDICFRAHNGVMGSPHIHTLEGMMEISDGDWIITGIAGERYPCKPDIFEKTYEPV